MFLSAVPHFGPKHVAVVFFLLITIMHTPKNILQKIVLTLITIHYLQKNIYDTQLLTSLTEYDTLH